MSAANALSQTQHILRPQFTVCAPPNQPSHQRPTEVVIFTMVGSSTMFQMTQMFTFILFLTKMF